MFTYKQCIHRRINILEPKWIYQINFGCESFAQLQRKNALKIVTKPTFSAQCFLNIDSCPFREGTKIKLSHQHWIFTLTNVRDPVTLCKKANSSVSYKKSWKLFVFYLYYEQQAQVLLNVFAYILNQGQNPIMSTNWSYLYTDS